MVRLHGLLPTYNIFLRTLYYTPFQPPGQHLNDMGGIFMAEVFAIVSVDEDSKIGCVTVHKMFYSPDLALLELRNLTSNFTHQIPHYYIERFEISDDCDETRH